jgi:hypothetical protein
VGLRAFWLHVPAPPMPALVFEMPTAIGHKTRVGFEIGWDSTLVKFVVQKIETPVTPFSPEIFKCPERTRATLLLSSGETPSALLLCAKRAATWPRGGDSDQPQLVRCVVGSKVHTSDSACCCSNFRETALCLPSSLAAIHDSVLHSTRD